MCLEADGMFLPYADKWAEIGKSVRVEFTRNGRTMKKISKIKKSSMESAGSYSGYYSLFVTVSLQLFECQMNSPRLVDQQQHKRE